MNGALAARLQVRLRLMKPRPANPEASSTIDGASGIVGTVGTGGLACLGANVHRLSRKVNEWFPQGLRQGLARAEKLTRVRKE